MLNKYFPPDFDPSKLPRGKRPDHNSMKVRMMLPMSVRCNTCGNFMYKGTKFNCKKQVSRGQLKNAVRIRENVELQRSAVLLGSRNP